MSDLCSLDYFSFSYLVAERVTATLWYRAHLEAERNALLPGLSAEYIHTLMSLGHLKSILISTRVDC